MPIDDQLVAWVRFALRHLYEPSLLRRSPLIDSLGLAGCANPTGELRQFLTREVRAMAPPADAPLESELRRTYEVLLYRYVQHDSQIAVADQLGISTRQLRREELKAMEALSVRLRPLAGGCLGAVPGCSDEEVSKEDAGEPDTVTDELAWLQRSGARGRVNSSDVLPSVLELVRLLAERYGVHIEVVGGQDGMPPVAAHRVALKQILLNLLTVAIRVTEGRRIVISVHRDDAHTTLRIEGAGLRPDPEHGAENDSNLDMARRLAESCDARVTVEQSSDGFVALATFRSLDQVSVLVIDDNIDTVRLLERYATGTVYRVQGVASVPEALTLAERVRPHIIVLDVMMPDIDGWEVLGQLRQHPLTAQVPILICTILSQQELALSLGASGFIRKPISRQGFLDALDQIHSLEVSRPS